MAPDATPIMLNKWQNSAVYARFFGCIAMRSEPPKLRAGGVGVGGSNPLVPTNYLKIVRNIYGLAPMRRRLHRDGASGCGCPKLHFASVNSIGVQGQRLPGKGRG